MMIINLVLNSENKMIMNFRAHAFMAHVEVIAFFFFAFVSDTINLFLFTNIALYAAVY